MGERRSMFDIPEEETRPVTRRPASFTFCTEPHDWQPVSGFNARYACSVCWALGYRRLVMGLVGERNRNHIETYKCPTCKGCTTARGRTCRVCAIGPGWVLLQLAPAGVHDGEEE